MSSYEAYDQRAAHFDRTRGPTGIEVIVGCLAQASAPLAGLTVLDAGCGTGNYARALLAHVARVEAVDLSAGMLEVARRKLADPALEHRAAFRQAAIEDLPLPDGAVDGVVVNQVLHHLPDDPAAGWPAHHRALRELARVLRPGGVCVMEMMGKEALVKLLQDLNTSRQQHYDTGEVQYIPAVATQNKPAAMMGDEPFEYYGTSRSWSPGWVNRYTTESIENLMSFSAVHHARHVAPTPLLIIHGKNDKFCLPKFAQEVYDKAGEPKEIMWVDAPNHIDIYDVEKYVEPAVNKTVEWFNKYLKGKSRIREELTA